ncbi:MAG TPA: ectoine synthase [Polyangiaceae bacterium LLY-WYZ-15_(1-7)]|nr:D-alanine--D-alanine ligase [Myxococcales bacterium]MAT27244.1 D-alanine--D-alanine ligase [Sandaracinus sp.]HJK93406.1 ectoine synthase [Polyangiaceae bacterium LLY-WYZ-15_(1-7)]MBJ72566.1 D-alanine--D-alanine ligase [Sandaracinus sp.]HJL05540.1 ectoine synthase [Polyangiaceae bacterium LLY-WYZ-15_(1-7)]
MKIVHVEDLLGTDREVEGPSWVSRRLLLRKDGFGFSLHETIVPAGAEMDLQYHNHLEAVYCVRGNGTIEDVATGETHRIVNGTLYGLDDHDRHILRGGTEDMRLICVFNPPVSGRETHDFEGSYEVPPRNVFIVGLDDYNLDKARAITLSSECDFHGLVDRDELIEPESYDLPGLIDKSLETLRAFDGPIDAIITHWDFPVSTTLPIINREMGLRYVPLVAMLKCEHKYWSRVEQKRVVPEMVPRFQALDPFDDHALEKLELDYPFFLKPIKGFASTLGFKIENAEEFAEAIETIRANIRRIGDEFTKVMEMVDLPPDIARVDGNWCLAEELMHGWQCGVEGYVLNGQTHIHGIFDCYKDRNGWSFNRYELPSRWPKQVQERMKAATKKLMAHLGYNQAPFGVEFFWDEERDKLWLIEINTRISQSHSDQFERVHGISNHEIAINVALGLPTHLDRLRGPYECAAKFHLRRYADCRVTRVPDAKNLQAVADAVPGDPVVHVTVDEGMQLSELRDQDTHSYEIATVRLGARDQEELLHRFRQVAEMLDFEFSDGGKVEDIQFLDPQSWD